jgi:elongation factor Ts
MKELRELTGAGMLEIKHALAESGNDKTKAIEILRKKGALKMGKKSDRIAKEGLVETYIHPGNKVGVLLELNCETDFVARTQDFKTLAKDLALHIAASNPLYLSSSDVPAAVLEKEKEIYKEQIKGKPKEVVEKIVAGKLAKYYEETCLLEQPFVKNPEIKVQDLLAEAVAKMGENIKVRRFARFVLGS